MIIRTENEEYVKVIAELRQKISELSNNSHYEKEISRLKVFETTVRDME